MKTFLIMTMLTVSTSVLANNPKTLPIKQPAPQAQKQEQSQEQHQSQTQTSNGGTATATGTSSATATALGGGGGGGGTASSDNALSMTYERSAPSLGQGSLMPSGCGMGANAGGSQPGGAAFLGFAFTTAECYKFLLAQHLTAIGMVDSACDVLMATKAATNAYKKAGLAKPKCDVPKPVVPADSNKSSVLVIEKGDYATKEELRRAFEASQRK